MSDIKIWSSEAVNIHGRGKWINCDDHIAEVEEVKRKVYEGFMSDLEALQARIAELEEYKRLNEMATLSMNNQIKAQGIEEMLSDWYENGFEKLDEHAKQYANKLRTEQ